MTAPATFQRAATVEFDHVTKSYDVRATKAGAPGAVNDLSLTIPAGKICVLVGPSAAARRRLAQDGQPAHRARRPGGSSSTASTRRRAT